MSQVDYTAMSYQELRRYFLKHHEDQAAFQAYLAGVKSDRTQSLQELMTRTSITRFKQQSVSN